MDIPMTDHDVVALEEFGKGFTMWAFQVERFMHYMSRVRALLAYCRAVTAERDALAAQLAALKKRVADAPKAMTYRPNGEGAYIPAVDVADGGTYALVRLEEGE